MPGTLKERPTETHCSPASIFLLPCFPYHLTQACSGSVLCVQPSLPVCAQLLLLSPRGGSSHSLLGAFTQWNNGHQITFRQLNVTGTPF